MEPLFYVMAIMGCSDGGTTCTEARVDQTHYASIQACQAAMPDVLARHTDLSYPVISSACRSSGVRMVETQSAKRAG